MRRKYTLEFKEETAKLVTEKGYSRSEAARSLGISNRNVRRWVDEHTGKTKKIERIAPSSEQDEITRLRKENDRLRMEREILKKAAAFFANEKN